MILVEGNNELNVQMVPIGIAEFAYVSGLRQSFFETGTIWGVKTCVRYEVDIQNQGDSPAVCSVMFQSSMQHPYQPGVWADWNTMDFTTKYYVNPAYTGGRTEEIMGLVEIELAPGETRTFWDSTLIAPYTYRDRVIGIELASGLGEIVVMR